MVFAPFAVLLAIAVAVNPERWLAPHWSFYASMGGLLAMLLFGFFVVPRTNYLMLTPEGLTIQYVGRRRVYSWDEIDNIRLLLKVKRGAAAHMVVFDLSPHSIQRTALVQACRSVNGYDVSLLATYELSAEEIVDQLTQWQARHGSRKE